jgi:hypothetical protein
MRKRMTRQQIKEGLEQVPIEQVLLGHNRAAHKVALTAKQLKFADALARGDTKAGAYRKAYDTKAKPQVQSIEGQKLSRKPCRVHAGRGDKVGARGGKVCDPFTS